MEQVNRVEIIQKCLEEEVIPRLIDFPPSCFRSDKTRNRMRVAINYLLNLMEGNEKYLSVGKSHLNLSQPSGEVPHE